MSKEAVSEEFVSDLLCKDKQAIQSISWKPFPDRTGQQFCYETALNHNEVTLEGILFRSIYQRLQPRTIGIATINFEERKKVMVEAHGFRVWAIDDDSKGHKNKSDQHGDPRPFAGKRLHSRAHLHMWKNGNCNYAEPLEPAPGSLEKLFQLVTAYVKIEFMEPFIHPLKGLQEQLFIQ